MATRLSLPWAACRARAPRKLRAWFVRVAPIAVAVVVPVVVAAAYFALWACAAAPANLRPIAPLPAGDTREWGVGAIAGQHYQEPVAVGDPIPPTRWGGGGQLWFSRRGRWADVGWAIKGGSFGVAPSFTLRFWPVSAERFRLGAGAELTFIGGMAEIPIGFAATDRFWIYAAPRVHNIPPGISVPAGMSLRVGSHAQLVLEGGGIVYSLSRSSDSLNDLAMNYYGAFAATFSY